MTDSNFASLTAALDEHVDVLIPLHGEQERREKEAEAEVAVGDSPSAAWPLFTEGMRMIARLMHLSASATAAAGFLAPGHVSPRRPFYGGGPLQRSARRVAFAAACPNMTR